MMSDNQALERRDRAKIRSNMKECEKWSKWRARAIKESDGDDRQTVLIGYAFLTELKAINKALAETNKTLAAIYKEVSGKEFDWESCERRKSELFDGFASAASDEQECEEGGTDER